MVAVSVIMPVYHLPHLVEKAVESLLQQTFEDFELLLIDDGSPDGCGELCEALASQDTRLRVFHQNNSGAWAARNTGLEQAQGHYIFFADADDICHPDLLETMVAAAEKEKLDFVRCRFARFSGEELLKAREEWEPQGELFQPTLIWQKLLLPLVGRRGKDPMLCGTACTTLMRRDIIEKNHLRFCPEKLGEDLLFMLRFLSCCQKGRHLPTVLYFYRHTPGSVTCEGFQPDKSNWLFRQNETLLAFGKEHGVLDEEYRIRVAARILDAASVHIKEMILFLPYAVAKNDIRQLMEKPALSVALSYRKRAGLPLTQKLCYCLASQGFIGLLSMLIWFYTTFFTR